MSILMFLASPKHAQRTNALKLVIDCDLLVMGTHGHTTFKDLLFGTTVESVRHKINIPLVLV